MKMRHGAEVAPEWNTHSHTHFTIVLFKTACSCVSIEAAWLTYDPEDAEDVGSEDDEQVDGGEEQDGDGDVSRPPERLVGEEELLDGSPHLRNTQR